MNKRTYVGLDVHARSVKGCAIDRETGEIPRQSLAANDAGVAEWVSGLPGPVVVVYEAGPTGFGLARLLTAAGIECLAAAPSKLQRPSGDRIKTDVRDAEHAHGVFQVLHGDREVVSGLLTHPDVDGISLVGSTPVAKFINEVATAHGNRVHALGGAKNHAIAMPDADLDNAADHLAAAAFGSAGQRCMAISVAVAADLLVKKVEERALDVRVKNGTEPDANMGPVISSDSKNFIVKTISEDEAAGAAMVVDGRDLVVLGHEERLLVGPTVIDHVKTEMSAYQEEIFGPVLVVVRVQDLEEGIKLINANPYGNGTAIFTSSGAAARKFQRSVDVCMIGINVPVPVPVAYYSFGGWKTSLFGDKHIYGPEGVSFYTRGKVITSRWPEASHASGASYNVPSN
jgi:malonate-semialdehyde dehydrogenase (acetylating)/methylmalonate-semialdehyde dehydrogenase